MIRAHTFFYFVTESICNQKWSNFEIVRTRRLKTKIKYNLSWRTISIVQNHR